MFIILIITFCATLHCLLSLWGFVRGSQLKLLKEKYFLRSCWMKLWSRFHIGKSCCAERKTDMDLPSLSCSCVQQEGQYDFYEGLLLSTKNLCGIFFTYLSCMYTHIKNNNLPKLHKWATWVCQILKKFCELMLLSSG